MNLIGNAIKFTSKGGVTVNVSWEWDDNGIDDEMVIADEGKKHIQNNKYFANISGSGNAKHCFPYTKIRENNYTKEDKGFKEPYQRSSPNVRYQSHDKKSGKAIISVADTGIGIKEDVIPKLFQPFNQADSSISGHYGGTGLGLWISKSIIELMKGKISIKSIEEVGSTFTIMFPATVSKEVKCFTGSIDSTKEYEKFINRIFRF